MVILEPGRRCAMARAVERPAIPAPRMAIVSTAVGGEVDDDMRGGGMEDVEDLEKIWRESGGCGKKR